MKKCSIRISVLSIVFSVMFLVVSSPTKAETLVSELHLESPSLLGSESYSVDGKDLKSNPLRGFLIPLKEGLNAFIDCASPLYQGVRLTFSFFLYLTPATV